MRRRTLPSSFRSVTTALAMAAACAAAGCAAEVYPPTVGGYTTVYAASVPPDMAVYPRVAYAGNYAYLVGNRWYYPAGSRWVVLQPEPQPLYRYRTTTYVQAPVYRPPVYRPAPPPPASPGPYYRPPPPRVYAPPSQYGYPPPPPR
jgi:hypothetical protein